MVSGGGRICSSAAVVTGNLPLLMRLLWQDLIQSDSYRQKEKGDFGDRQAKKKDNMWTHEKVLCGHHGRSQKKPVLLTP